MTSTIAISDKGVGIDFTIQQSKVAMPATVIHMPGKQPRITVPLRGTMAIRSRAQRDPKLFIS